MSLSYCREIPRIFVVGQMEPQVEVPAPGANNANEIENNWILLQLLLLFESHKLHGSISSDRVSEVFPTTDKSKVRTQIQKV